MAMKILTRHVSYILITIIILIFTITYQVERVPAVSIVEALKFNTRASAQIVRVCFVVCTITGCCGGDQLRTLKDTKDVELSCIALEPVHICPRTLEGLGIEIRGRSVDHDLRSV